MIKDECTSLKKCILDKNDTYIYFEMIRRVEPSSVIDIGMFLKRIGAIARQAMDVRIEENIRLEGIDIMPELKVDIYGRLYDDVRDIDEFYRDINVEKEHEILYDMAILLDVNRWIAPENMDDIFRWVSKHTFYALTDQLQGKEAECLRQDGKVREITVDKKKYYLLIF